MMKNSSLFKKISGDLLWSIAAVCLMNGAIQVLIYPQLHRWLGTEKYGDMLFLISIVALFSSGIGLALNNTRLILSKEYAVGNSEYLLWMALYLIPATGITIFFAKQYFAMLPLSCTVFLLWLMTLRYYCDVEYRLSLRYRSYFVFYLILTLGYTVGLALYRVTGSWINTLTLGELSCVLFCAIRGSVFYPLKRPVSFWRVGRTAISLVVANILYSAVIQLDRILLRSLLGSREVTVFYVASLLGKVIALIVGPLNAIIISYLSRSEGKLSRRQAMQTIGIFLAVGMLFYGMVSVASPLVIRTLYPEIYDEVMPFTMLANLGQVLCFVGSLELTLLLTIAPPWWQTVIQSVYVLVFLGGGVIGVQMGGLSGFVFATVVAGVLRMGMTIVVMLRYLAKNGGKGE